MEKTRIKLLLVEDNMVQAKFIQGILNKSDEEKFVIKWANSFLKTKEILSEKEFDIILLDLMLPDSEGFDTFKSVYELSPHIPIIVLSGLSKNDLAIKAVQYGAQDYIVKGTVDATFLRRSIHYAIERKKNQEALRESEEQYKILFEASPNGILTLDVKTEELIYANPAACRILGYSENELKQKEIDQFFPEINLKMLRSDFRSHIKGNKKDVTADLPCLRKDGTVIFVDINGVVTKMHGRTCSIIFLRDMTKQKFAEETLHKLNEKLENEVLSRTEELRKINFALEEEIKERKWTEIALLESNARFSSIVFNCPAIIYLKDLEGQYMYINPVFEKTFNISNEDLLGKTDHSIFPEELAERLHEADLKVIEEKIVKNYDEHISSQGKSNHYLAMKFCISDYQNKLYGICGILIDITNRKFAKTILENCKEQLQM